MMGASNPHPHCQIWATASIPEAPAKRLTSQKAISASTEAAYCATTSNLRAGKDPRSLCQRTLVALCLSGGLAFRVADLQPAAFGDLGDFSKEKWSASPDSEAGDFCV